MLSGALSLSLLLSPCLCYLMYSALARPLLAVPLLHSTTPFPFPTLTCCRCLTPHLSHSLHTSSRRSQDCPHSRTSLSLTLSSPWLTVPLITPHLPVRRPSSPRVTVPAFTRTPGCRYSLSPVDCPPRLLPLFVHCWCAPVDCPSHVTVGLPLLSVPGDCPPAVCIVVTLIAVVSRRAFHL